MTKIYKLIKLFKTPEGFFSSILIILLIFLAIFGSSIAPYSPTELRMRERLESPSSRFWFGTDEMGRDVLSRVMTGAKTSLIAGLNIVIIATLIGVPLGLISGYFGGYIDTVISMVTDMFLGFPPLILAVAVSAALGPGLTNGVIAVSLVWWPGYVRLTRSETLSTKNQEYVEAAKAVGCSDFYVIIRHIFPSCFHSIIVKQTMDIGYGILFVASLGFLGLGAQEPQPEWGAMIAHARPYILDYWWAGVFPGLFIMFSALAFNLFGDSLQTYILPSLSKEGD